MISIPLIDIGVSGRRSETTSEIEAAFRDVGFAYIGGHGISPQLIANMREVVIAYFERPLEEKLCDRISRENYRGYIPEGFFNPATGGDASDRYEGYKLHLEISPDDEICGQCDLYGPNKWPDVPRSLRQVVLDYWAACDVVANTLLEYLASIIGVEPKWFLSQFEQSLTNMTLLHYPAQHPGEPGFGIHPHKDTDALTILAPDKVGGLLVKLRDSEEWIEVDAPDDALVVNIGDMLELWSGGYFVSTPHKVVNMSGSERYSFPYFVVPRFDAVVAPIKDPQPGFERSSVHVGDVSRAVWRSNWPDVVNADSAFDLGTLED
jgi:isopenicillin N synthase-like dioxygenase